MPRKAPATDGPLAPRGPLQPSPRGAILPVMKVDYDAVAPTYDERYRRGEPAGIAPALDAVAGGAGRVLEVGCGTGHWLAAMATRAGFACGLDRSRGMLERAGAAGVPLLQADACALPLRAGCVDALVCVNALHHFADPPGFVAEAARVLRRGGRIAVIGMDPAAGRDRWYLYDHFPGTRETDLARYPSSARIAAWLENAGFAGVERGIAARIQGGCRGREVYDDPILSRHGTSQLALLDDGAFAAGMARIETSARAAEREFVTDISLALVTGSRA